MWSRNWWANPYWAHPYWEHEAGGAPPQPPTPAPPQQIGATRKRKPYVVIPEDEELWLLLAMIEDQ